MPSPIGIAYLHTKFWNLRQQKLLNPNIFVPSASRKRKVLSVRQRKEGSNRLLKNAHLLRCPAASPSWRRGKKSLLIRRDATPHPSSLRRTSKYASGRLTNSSAWQRSLLIRRDATLRILGAPAGSGISQGSTCICLPAEASAQAGAFLSSPRKLTFSANC